MSKKTNYENIKNMSVDEMSEALMHINDKICFQACLNATGNKFECPIKGDVDLADCQKCFKKWLLSEVEENDRNS